MKNIRVLFLFVQEIDTRTDQRPKTKDPPTKIEHPPILCRVFPLRQIKDPLAAELQDLAEEAMNGVDTGAEPKPEKYIELVFGQEIVELEGFMEEIKVQ